MSSGQGQWKNRYEFDTPVLHVEKTPGKDNHPTSAEARKLMHRFKEADVERLMDEAEKDATPSS
ncbi:hypothetical protein H2199_001581 [Coniosporium tulheliwenetii]|uniref:Uncharacterized protein n=1 Tax=Coniosporium tulheliwenetii TaxID=3383036 RepID=A0ACC2ZJR9_9PEZI|nr:hypothetical protein H2199_001581 [Cladosporium sp. JES 115]